MKFKAHKILKFINKVVDTCLIRELEQMDPVSLVEIATGSRRLATRCLKAADNIKKEELEND